MSTGCKSFLFSLLLHLVLVGGALSFAGIKVPQDKPVLIDFTIENAQVAEQDMKRSDPGGTPPPSRTKPAPKTAATAAPPVPPPPKTLHQPAVAQVSPEAAPVAPPVASLPAPVHAAGAAQAAPAASSAAVASSSFGGSHGGKATTASEGSGSGSPGKDPKGESTETLRSRYLKKHFAYIRDLVAGNMRYPGLARRMGWSGTLLIEFVVQKDGSADMVRIVSSSGVPLLDRDARETVLKSAPFPKPPVSATLRFPMEYKLEN